MFPLKAETSCSTRIGQDLFDSKKYIAQSGEFLDYDHLVCTRSGLPLDHHGGIARSKILSECRLANDTIVFSIEVGCVWKVA